MMENKFNDLKGVLEKHGFLVKIFENSEMAKEELLKEISIDESVALGGSMTLQQMGIYENLKNRGNEVIWHWRKDVESPLQKAINTDSYITSTNAITMDGKLVNMDGTANRVAGMVFGHKNVYIIVGKNKVCKDYEEARERIKNIAAPLNAKRLNLSTPCAITGKCNDCNTPQRICRVETIIHRNPNSCQIHIYLVDEELGY